VSLPTHDGRAQLFDPFDWRAILGAAVGGALSYLVMTRLPGSLLSAFVCAASFAFISFVTSRAVHPFFWWAGVGAVAGIVVSVATLLSGGDHDVDSYRTFRYTVIGALALAGLAAGIQHGMQGERENKPDLVDFIKRVTGLTVIEFAIVVTSMYPARGLDVARATQSRLSTMITIVATALAIPGWIGLLIGSYVRKRRLE
jgi:hypothetical protein